MKGFVDEAVESQAQAPVVRKPPRILPECVSESIPEAGTRHMQNSDNNKARIGDQYDY